MNTVTVTEFTQGISDYLTRVSSRGESFTLIRNKKPLAELRPVQMERKLEELPEILNKLPKLSSSEINDFEKDLADIRMLGNHEKYEDPWES